MIYQDSFRDKSLVQGMARQIAMLAKGKGPFTFMEVCGTHTMAIYQYGLRLLMPPEVRLISGPGCPVCVTPNGYLDRAIALGRLPDVVIASFGDMLRVPGSSSSLLHERAKGSDIRVVYSPLDAVQLAQKIPHKRVVFLGVGFETTAPTIAGSILAAQKLGLDNYFVLASHKTMPQAMEILAADPEISISGYLCPAHVSAVIGADAYRPLCGSYRVPCVVTGFEPADVMQGVEMLVRQAVAGESKVEIQYSRVVSRQGNARAQGVLEQVFEVCDAEWRGIGNLSGSGLKIAEPYAAFDAERALEVQVEDLKEHEGCRCGEVLKGKLAPFNCSLFGACCTPESPVGACMVSSEGSCAAAFKYGR